MPVLRQSFLETSPVLIDGTDLAGTDLGQAPVPIWRAVVPSWTGFGTDLAAPGGGRGQVGRGGTPPSIRSLFLRQNIWSIVEKKCPEAKHYAKGAVIHEAGSVKGVRRLLFVERGVIRSVRRELSDKQQNKKSNGRLLRENSGYRAGWKREEGGGWDEAEKG